VTRTRWAAEQQAERQAEIRAREQREQYEVHGPPTEESPPAAPDIRERWEAFNRRLLELRPRADWPPLVYLQRALERNAEVAATTGDEPLADPVHNRALLAKLEELADASPTWPRSPVRDVPGFKRPR